MTGVTPGQALHDSLRKSAVIEFDLDIESFETWEHIRPSQRNRLEAAASAVAGNLADAYDAARKQEAAIAAQQPQTAPDDSPQADSRDEALSVARWMLRRIALGQERDPSVGADKALVMIRELLDGTGHDLSEVERNLADRHLARAFTAGAQHAQQPQPARRTLEAK